MAKIKRASVEETGNVSHKQLEYYMQEMQYLRQEGKVFALAYPQLAGELGIDEEHFHDPHLGRLMQSFAFMTARISQKIEEQFEYINQSLLQVLGPRFLYDIPPFVILQFLPSEKNHGFYISDRSLVTQKLEIDDSESAEKKQLDINVHTVYPIKVTGAHIESAEIRAGSDFYLSCKHALKMKISDIDTNKLRVFIDSNYIESIKMYRLLFDTQHNKSFKPNKHGIKHIINDKVESTEVRISITGFDQNEYLYSNGQIEDKKFADLFDFFAYYKKFMFFDLEFSKNDLVIAEQQGYLELIFPLSDNVHAHGFNISAGIFKFNCTPAVNLFKRETSPIQSNPYDTFLDVYSSDNNYQIHSIHSVSGYIRTDEGYEQKGYKNYFESTINTSSWVSRKINNQFQLGLIQTLSSVDTDSNNSNNVEEYEDDIETLIPYAMYYNRDLSYTLLGSVDDPQEAKESWFLDESISGLKITNISTFTSAIPGIEVTKYSSVVRMLNTRYALNELERHNVNKVLQDILVLFAHMNSNHAGVEKYIINIEVNNTVIHKRIGGMLCPIPGLKYLISYDTHKHQAYLFALVFGHFLRKNGSLGMEVEFELQAV